ncbi:MAG: glycosyltransferase family 2 protein [Planctomycetota bacterium]
MAIDNKTIAPERQTYPKVAVIILHLKDIPCLVDCIISLNKITYRNFNIIIAHNGPESIALLDALAPISRHITKVIDMDANIGFTRANNIGIRHALRDEAEYILLLNDDTEVAPDFLTTLIDVAELRPDAGMLGPKILFYDQPQKIWFAGARFNPETCMATATGFNQAVQYEDSVPIESDFITGCALLIKRKAIEKIGLLDERIFIYCEDLDWGLRLIKAGLKNLVVPDARIWHKVSITVGGLDSPFTIYHKTRSRLLMAKLYVPKSLYKLHRKFLCDIAWLLFKSHGPSKIKKAGACFLAMIDYHSGKTGKGPDWLMTNA